MNSTTPTVATIGSLIVDLAVATPRVPVTGENILAHTFKKGPGGKGANAAAAIARMGARSFLVGAVGDDDFGRMELAALREIGVTTSGVTTDPSADTGIAIIMVDDSKENTILVVMGANETLTEDTALGALEGHWPSLDAILVNFEIPPTVVASVLAEAARRGVPSFLDAGPPRSYGHEIWHQATVVSPNHGEVEALVGRPLEAEEQLREAAQEILSRGPQAVVIKRGAQGCLVVTHVEERFFPAHSVEVVDTTGAGDAFSAAFTVAMAEGKDVFAAADWGTAAGAIAVTQFGTMAAMPTRAEVDALLRR